MRALRLLAVLGLAGAALVAGPGPDAGAEQTGPVVAGQDAYVISTAVRTTYDTPELRVRSTAAQKLQHPSCQNRIRRYECPCVRIDR